MTIRLKWDAIDNRNMQTLTDIVREQGVVAHHLPSTWDAALLSAVLYAMRKAGDEALTDQVTVRLERSFSSTRDVRGGAALVIPDQQP